MTNAKIYFDFFMRNSLQIFTFAKHPVRWAKIVKKKEFPNVCRMKVPKPILFAVSCVVGFFVLALSADAQAVRTAGVNKVVIDAGHGGNDPGTHYGQFKEKDINLAVALRLGRLIEANYPDVSVIYTRTTDVRVNLADRADKANKAAADLFISIHVNGAKSSQASGTETFVMGVSKAQQNLELAMKENDVIVYEEDYKTRYQGYTPGSTESFIIFSLMQYSYQGQSLNLASIVQKHYTQNLPMGNRGVKQAGFLVLWYATMPSILTELGFISNPQDRKILTTKNGQEKLARSLFNAFSEYKVKSEGKGKLIVLPEESVEEDASEPSTASAAISEEARSEAPICYRVQVMSSPKKVPRNSSRFGTYRGQVKEIVIAGNYKYFVGEVASYREALSLQSEVRKQIRDAFVVAFEGERTISVQEARQRE